LCSSLRPSDPSAPHQIRARRCARVPSSPSRCPGGCLGPGRGRCVSIFLLDKNKRHIGKFQSKQSPRRTQRPPHRCRVVRGIQRRQRRGVVELDALRQLRDRGGPRLRKVAQLVRVASQVEQPGVCVVRVWAALGASWHRGGHADGWRAARRDVVAVALSWSPQYQPAAAATMPSSPQVSSTDGTNAAAAGLQILLSRR
jgi:hypothetical protein